jgi:hypothetical protein
MNSLKLCLALVLGIVLGALIRPLTTKAQSNNAGEKVTVQRVPSLGAYTATPIPQGQQVVGFSCVHGDNGEACYVASK